MWRAVNFEVETPLPPSEVLIRLRLGVERPSRVGEKVLSVIDSLLDDSGVSDRYTGRVEAGSFALHRLLPYKYPWEAEIRGVVAGTGAGSLIRVSVRLSLMRVLVLLAMTLGVALIAFQLRSLWDEIPGLRIAPWIAGTLAVFFWGPLFWLVPAQAKRFEAFLRASLRVHQATGGAE